MQPVISLHIRISNMTIVCEKKRTSCANGGHLTRFQSGLQRKGTYSSDELSTIDLYKTSVNTIESEYEMAMILADILWPALTRLSPSLALSLIGARP